MDKHVLGRSGAGDELKGVNISWKGGHNWLVASKNNWVKPIE